MEFESIIIRDTATVLDALKALDQTARKVLFIEKDGRLKGALSDGDIRRWILKKGSLDARISEFANFSPKYITESDRAHAKEYMIKMQVQAVPVVDSDMRITDIIFLYEQTEKTNSEPLSLPVVIMAGGKGTRLYPYTKILPKPLIPIGDIPITEHIINRFHQSGCNDFYFIINHKKNMIKAYYNEIDRDYHITYIDENIPLGTGGGISLLKGMMNTTFILTNCDSIITEDYANILMEHRKKNNAITMICSLRNYEVPYGVVKIGQDGIIEEMQEKPSMSFFTNTGTYIVEPDVIDLVQKNEAITFPEIIQRAKIRGMKTGVYPVNENSWLDMGQFNTMENMKNKLNIKD